MISHGSRKGQAINGTGRQEVSDIAFDVAATTTMGIRVAGDVFHRDDLTHIAPSLYAEQSTQGHR